MNEDNVIIQITKSTNPYIMIHKEIINNPKITARAKGIYCYLRARPEGWKIQITHLYKQFLEGRDAINKALRELEENGYIIKEKAVGGEQKNGGWNIIFCETVGPPTGNPHLLYTNSINTVKENSNSKSFPKKSNINSNSCVDLKEEKMRIKELFRTRFSDKTKEIAGVEAKLPWSGKEGNLLKLDLETHGEETLIKYIEIFFSDKDPAVADFTRHRNKAGYSFSVFHGMISKLSISKVKPRKVCPECGRTVGHDPECPVEEKRRIMIQLEKDEVNSLKDENKNFSFTDALKDVINK